MDVERSLVSKVVSTGNVHDLISRGLRPEHFRDEQARTVLEHVLDHHRSYGTAPTMDAVNDWAEAREIDFKWAYSQDALNYLIDRMITLIKHRQADESVLELARICDDPERVKNIDLEFLEVARSLATAVPSVEVKRFKDIERRIAEYEKRAKEGHLPGVPFGFPTLDKWTGGLQQHELCALTAFTGIGKSTLIIRYAANCWLNGLTPLYISLEMEADIILQRIDAMLAGLNYETMKQLRHDEKLLKDWRAFGEKVRELSADIPVIDSIGDCTVDHVFAETVRHKPDVVIVDYVQLMVGPRLDSDWREMRAITRQLKQNARVLGIPIVVAAQTGRSGGKEGATLGNVGGSISVSQDPDVVIGLHQDDEMREAKLMDIRLNKNRRGPLGTFSAIWDHENMEFRERLLKDMFGRGGDKSGDSEKSGKPPKRADFPAHPSRSD